MQADWGSPRWAGLCREPLRVGDCAGLIQKCAPDAGGKKRLRLLVTT